MFTFASDGSGAAVRVVARAGVLSGEGADGGGWVSWVLGMALV
jgi:hypothetical protein